MPIPRLIDGPATGGVTGETELGLRALFSLSAPVRDVPATVELPGLRRSAADSDQKRIAALPLGNAAGIKSMRVLAIVPAHNEAASIAETIKSLRGQTWAPDEILVVVNNSTDDTAQISRDLGACVYDVGQISGRKAGA